MDITFFIHEDHTPGAVNWEAPWNYAHNFPKLTLNRGSKFFRFAQKDRNKDRILITIISKVWKVGFEGHEKKERK